MRQHRCPLRRARALMVPTAGERAPELHCFGKERVEETAFGLAHVRLYSPCVVPPASLMLVERLMRMERSRC